MNKAFILFLFIFVACGQTPLADIMGKPTEITVRVIGCLTNPLDDARALLLGETEAKNESDGNYTFAKVYPGEYTLFAYSTYSDYYTEKLLIGKSYSALHLNVMLCTAWPCVREVAVEVVGPSGKKVRDANVSVPELFVEGETDKNGRVVFTLPPGEWEIYTAGANASVVVAAPDPGEEPGPIKLVVRTE